VLWLKCSAVLSLILPVYNGARYLRESIASVLAQTLGEFELIIWDDGSTDDSRAIAAEFSDPRIVKFANETNLGLFPTLNRAIAAARSDRIRLWSQDDIMGSDCLEREAAYFSRFEGWGMGYCYYDVIDEHGSVILRRPDEKQAKLLPSAWTGEIMFFHGSLTGNIANMTLRREVLQEVGGFREDYRYAADFDLIERISARYAICCIYEPLMFLRSHDGQFSRRPRAYLDSMREGEEIHQRLRARLGLGGRYVQRYDAWSRGVQDAHYSFRLALHGDFSGYRLLFKQARLRRSALWWLVTANRRLYTMPRKYSAGLAEHMAWEPKWLRN
jgi:glycosyltransferase involved in cell wall biosynthesis